MGKGGGERHGGTSSADEYTHQGALNEKLHRERPVRPPIPLVTLLAASSRGTERERERERAVSRRFAFEACPPAETRLEFADRVPGIEAPSRNDVKCRCCTIESSRLLEIPGHWQAYLDVFA